uniref:Peptidase C1A papain C-terminal domain-containing protein n=1 Tax=Aegilops tauschii TaxID=37682 RepID=M8BX80_AEGTA
MSSDLSNREDVDGVATQERVKKINASEWSWRKRLYKQCNIAPDVMDQEDRDICEFCAVISAAIMELKRATANVTPGAECCYKLDMESLIRTYLELNGMDPLAEKEVVEAMEKHILTNGNDIYGRHDGVCWCFKNVGVKATLNGNKLPFKLGIDDYKFSFELSAKEVWKRVESGRAVLATVFAGEEFDELQADEIYAWFPKYDCEKKDWVKKPQPHRVVLIGNGDAGSDLLYQYHPFCNSHGTDFADGGDGSVFHRVLRGFGQIDIKAHPNRLMVPLSQISERPRLRQRRPDVAPTPPPPPPPPPSNLTRWRADGPGLTPPCQPWQSMRGDGPHRASPSDRVNIDKETPPSQLCQPMGRDDPRWASPSDRVNTNKVTPSREPWRPTRVDDSRWASPMMALTGLLQATASTSTRRLHRASCVSLWDVMTLAGLLQVTASTPTR